VKPCELSGTGVQSHRASFSSEALGLAISVKVSVETFRAIYAAGGLDQWLRRTPSAKLSAKAKRLKRMV
jgi:ribosomal protein L28